jgi:type II secretory pathway predicted ATPase ExeA
LLSDLSGLTLLTGEAGTGKTTLIYSLLARDYKRLRIAHIEDPKLSFLEMMRIVMTQLNLHSAGTTKLDYLNVLDHLLDLYGKEERIAIVVDESQVLSDDTLEELRLLSNRGTRNDRCLQLVLVGQPELAERLKKPELRQLNQRISSRGVLKPLTLAQGVMYVECRLGAQGGKVSAIFEPGALNHLLKRSDGIPRKINMLCHSAMLAGFYASERKVSTKTAKKIAEEDRDSVAIMDQGFRRRRLAQPSVIAIAALASLLLLGFFYPNLWPDWIRSRIGLSNEANEQAIQAHQPSRRVKKVKQAKTVEKPVVEAAATVPPHPVVAGAPVAAALAAPKSDVTGRPTPPAIGIISTAPAAAAANVGTEKQNGVPGPQKPRSQITVRFGDTLEEIAIRYFGSKSGLNELVKMNPQLTDINQLTVGETIYLPPCIARKNLTLPGRIRTAGPERRRFSGALVDIAARWRQGPEPDSDLRPVYG